MDLFLFVRLAAAHLVADFLVQPGCGVKQRRDKRWRSSWLYIHGAIAGISAFVFSARWSALWLPFVIAISHVLIDGFKVRRKESTLSFFLDQIAHIAVILGSWLLLTGEPDGLWRLTVDIIQDVDWWIVVFGYVAAIWPAGIVVGGVTSRWHIVKKDPSNPMAGADRAGLLIGRLERFLILTFVLLGHYEAIGFLIAAKSVFRFGELRQEAEYIIIGSMMSFSIAVSIGIVVRHLLALA